MKKQISLGCLLLSLFAVSGCDQASKKSLVPSLASQTPIEVVSETSSKTGIILDPALSQDERNTVTSDLDRAESLEIHAEPGSYFTKIFGSPDNSGVMRYLSERIHYILPRSVKLDSRLSHFEYRASSAPIALQRAEAFHIYTVALNMGTSLWFEALGSAPKPLQIKIGQTWVPVQSSRVGIIQLGEGYTIKTPDPTLSSQILRIAILVHEARHSDCTGGISSSDLDKLQMGDDPEKSNCGHLHVRCPEGHTYDGAYACDEEAWGAYSVQATYLGSIVKHCSNCTAEEKSIATTIYADSLDRVIPKADLIAGKVADPDMSSSTEVIPTQDIQ